MPTPGPVPQQLVSIQYLRAVAAGMVVLFHMGLPLQRMGYPVSGHVFLSRGVDVFFVISGFIMWATTYGKAATPAGFYWRRIARIVPLYWLLTGLNLLILLGAPSVVQSGRAEPWHILASFLFVPAVHPVTGVYEPLLIPGWTLNYEMVFYAVFGAALLLPPRLRLPAVWACLLLSVLTGLAAPYGSIMAEVYGSSIVLEFGFGLLLGALFTRGTALPAWSCWALLVAGFAALWWFGGQEHQRALMAGVPSLAVVGGALFLERAGRVRDLPWLHLLGDASYSLYLSHGMALSACGQIAQRAGLGAVPGGFPLFVLLAGGASAAAAVALFLLVERPLTRLLLARRPPAVVADTSAEAAVSAGKAVLSTELPARD